MTVPDVWQQAHVSGGTAAPIIGAVNAKNVMRRNAFFMANNEYNSETH